MHDLPRRPLRDFGGDYNTAPAPRPPHSGNHPSRPEGRASLGPSARRRAYPPEISERRGRLRERAPSGVTSVPLGREAHRRRARKLVGTHLARCCRPGGRGRGKFCERQERGGLINRIGQCCYGNTRTALTAPPRPPLARTRRGAFLEK